MARAKTRAVARILIKRRNPLFQPVHGQPSKKSSKGESQN